MAGPVVMFGARLPGPFRVGISSSGHVNAGVTVGPLSASTNVGGRRPARPTEVFAPVHLLDAVAELLDAGWKVTGQGDGWAIVVRRMMALQLDAVPGGTVARRVTSRAGAIATGLVLAGGVVLALLCIGALS